MKRVAEGPPGEGWDSGDQLLLVSAVNRFGATDWTAVSKAIRQRLREKDTTLTTPKACEAQFARLIEMAAAEMGYSRTETGSFPHLLELMRRRRMAQLQENLTFYDDVIRKCQAALQRLRSGQTTGADMAFILKFSGGRLDPTPVGTPAAAMAPPAPLHRGALFSPASGAASGAAGAEGDGLRSPVSGVPTPMVLDAASPHDEAHAAAPRDIKPEPLSPVPVHTPTAAAAGGRGEDEEGRRTRRPAVAAVLDRILGKVCEHPQAPVFMKAVPKAAAPDYDKTVYRRMDLSNIRSRARAGKLTVMGCYRDLLLVAQNALMYNSVGTPVWTAARDLKHFIIQTCAPFVAEAAAAAATAAVPAGTTPLPDAPDTPAPLDLSAAAASALRRRDKRAREDEPAAPPVTPAADEPAPTPVGRGRPRGRPPGSGSATPATPAVAVTAAAPAAPAAPAATPISDADTPVPVVSAPKRGRPAKRGGAGRGGAGAGRRRGEMGSEASADDEA